MDRVKNSLSRMKDVAKSSFNDVCNITHITITGTSLGQNTTTQTPENNVPCGFVEQNTYRGSHGEIITFEADSILRLSLTQDIATTDLVEVRGNNYRVNGIKVGLTVKIIPLKRVEDTND